MTWDWIHEAEERGLRRWIFKRDGEGWQAAGSGDLCRGDQVLEVRRDREAPRLGRVAEVDGGARAVRVAWGAA